MKTTLEFSAGLLFPRGQFLLEIKKAAFKLDVTVEVESSGWLQRDYLLKVEGSPESILTLARYVQKLAGLNS